jgi:hypothetical protein
MPKRHALLAIVVLALASCGGAATMPSASHSPASPSAPPETEGVDHPDGAGDLVLRLEEGGGMMMVEWVAASAPVFSLYGDGTVVFRNAADPMPDVNDGLVRGNPYWTAKLTEPKVQELLEFAVNQGALGIARARYDNNTMADASTTTFTIEAGGTKKVVEVYALMEAGEESQDAVVRRAFAALAERLRDFGADADLLVADYAPAAYRGTLIEAQGAPGQVADWPWPEVAIADFEKPADQDFGFPRRLMSPSDVEALGAAEVEGGVHGIYLEGPDGKVYSFVLRPLLPDETI